MDKNEKNRIIELWNKEKDIELSKEEREEIKVLLLKGVAELETELSDK